MKIKRMYIKNFGIFKDEKLDDINENIIVIGGHNRAGKTTFLKLFRHLGFGFINKDKDLPTSKMEYGVNYDIENNEGEVFNVDIQGNKNVVVKCLNKNREISIEEIFGHIDYFTYKQLFTISLDELQNTSVENSKDIDNLQSVLLGAGFKEIIKIPKMIKDIDKNARKIGGKCGNPSTAQFKRYNKEIKSGIELREEASSKVEEYYDKKNKLDKVKSSIENLEQKIEYIRYKIDTVKLIKNNFNIYEKFKDLNEKLDRNMIKEAEENFKYEYIEQATNLKKEYEKIISEYKNKELEFTQKVSKNKDLRYKILKYKHCIEKEKDNISGLLEKIDRYKELEENCIKEEKDILEKVYNINHNWQGDFNKILDIKVDLINISELEFTIQKYKSLLAEKENIQEDIKSLNSNKMIFEKIISPKGMRGLNKVIKKYFYICLFIIILGLILCFINNKIGFIMSLSGSILGAGVMIIQYFSKSRTSYLNREKYVQIESLNSQVNLKNEKLNKLNEDLQLCIERINSYKSILDINEEISEDTVKTYFIEVKNIKNRITSLEYLKDKTSKVYEDISDKLNSMIILIKQFLEISSIDCDYNLLENLLENSKTIFNNIRKLYDFVIFSEEFYFMEDKKISIENRIASLLKNKFNKDNIITSLDVFIKDNEEYKKILERRTQLEVVEKTLTNVVSLISSKNRIDFKILFKEYDSYYELEQEVQRLEKYYREYKDKLNNLIKMEQDLNFKLKDLYTTKDIENAQIKIDSAREGLMFIAKEYATLKASKFILASIQSNFIEKTKGSLLDKASKYLYEITGGEYKKILPKDNLIELDFKTVSKDGTINTTSEVLSRATKEQLFLAVRLSRIKEIKPNLPIIFDDSFVNFDEFHISQVIKIIQKLSISNQIFITTCHSKFVEYISKISQGVKYIKIDRGKVYKTDKSSLIEHLSENSKFTLM